MASFVGRALRLVRLVRLLRVRNKIPQRQRASWLLSGERALGRWQLLLQLAPIEQGWHSPLQPSRHAVPKGALVVLAAALVKDHSAFLLGTCLSASLSVNMALH